MIIIIILLLELVLMIFTVLSVYMTWVPGRLGLAILRREHAPAGYGFRGEPLTDTPASPVAGCLLTACSLSGVIFVFLFVFLMALFVLLGWAYSAH